MHACTSAESLPLRSRWRIGVLQRVTVSAGNSGATQLEWLPRSVVELQAKQFYGAEPLLLDHLPSALRALIIEGEVPQPSDGWRPPSTLTHMEVGRKWTRLVDLALPDSLQTLILSPYFSDAAVRVQQLPPLPPSLTALDLGRNWNGATLPPLPLALTDLNLAGYSGPLAELRLPHSLLRLKINCADTPLAALCLPPQLQSLRLGLKFNASLAGVALPASLTELHFDCDSGSFNQPMEHLQLPAGLRSLHLSKMFNQPIAALRLPASLIELKLGSDLDQALLSLAHTPLQSLDMSHLHRWHQSSAD